MDGWEFRDPYWFTVCDDGTEWYIMPLDKYDSPTILPVKEE